MNTINAIKSDYYRYFGNTKFKSFFKAYFAIPGFKVMFWKRMCYNHRGG